LRSLDFDFDGALYNPGCFADQDCWLAFESFFAVAALLELAWMAMGSRVAWVPPSHASSVMCRY
jgi:hypothetical protein